MFGRAGGALTGDLDGLAEAEARLKSDPRIKVVMRPPVTKAAYHSAAFEPMQASFKDELTAVLADAATESKALLWYTSIDGGRTTVPAASALDPAFWWTGLRAPALSQAACEAVLDDGHRLFLELNGSPYYCDHPIGDEMAERGLSPRDADGVCGVSLCTIRADVAEVGAEVQMLAALCRLWCAGVVIDWGKLHQTLGQTAAV